MWQLRVPLFKYTSVFTKLHFTFTWVTSLHLSKLEAMTHFSECFLWRRVPTYFFLFHRSLWCRNKLMSLWHWSKLRSLWRWPKYRSLWRELRHVLTRQKWHDNLYFVTPQLRRVLTKLTTRWANYDVDWPLWRGKTKEEIGMVLQFLT